MLAEHDHDRQEETGLSKRLSGPSTIEPLSRTNEALPLKSERKKAGGLYAGEGRKKNLRSQCVLCKKNTSRGGQRRLSVGEGERLEKD